MPKRSVQHDQYDTPWKDMLTTYFEQFLRFFFPDVADDIDWPKGHTALDKELRQIARGAKLGPRLADYLVQVWKTTGEETWVLVHIEVQAQTQTDFAHRMFVYNYRIHDRYHRPVASFAILADDQPNWLPSQYSQELWRCRTEFTFPVAKLLTYKEQQPILESSTNPFAMVVLAHLKTLETQKNFRRRWQWKVNLLKELYTRGFSREEILALYRFIDWIMRLPEDLEQACYQELVEFEEEQRMPYITTAERIGMKKGLEQGLQQGMEQGLEQGLQQGMEQGLQQGIVRGVEKGAIIGEILLAQRILKLIIYDREELERKSLEDLQGIFAKFDAKLQEKAL